MDIADIQAECSAGVNGYGGRRRRRSRIAATATTARLGGRARAQRRRKKRRSDYRRLAYELGRERHPLALPNAGAIVD
jgi:hypothetical protein